MVNLKRLKKLKKSLILKNYKRNIFSLKKVSETHISQKFHIANYTGFKFTNT